MVNGSITLTSTKIQEGAPENRRRRFRSMLQRFRRMPRSFRGA